MECDPQEFFFLVFNKGRNNQTLSHYKTRKQASRIITLSEQQQFHVNLIKLIYVEMIRFKTLLLILRKSMKNWFLVLLVTHRRHSVAAFFTIVATMSW